MSAKMRSLGEERSRGNRARLAGAGAAVLVAAVLTFIAPTTANAASLPQLPVMPQTVGSVPSAPTDVWAEALAGQAWVNWTPPTNTGGSPITGYVVTVYRNGTQIATYPAAPILNARIIPGLQTDGTAYTFRVAAVNVVGNSALSAATNSTVPYDSPPPDVFAGGLDLGSFLPSVVTTSPDGYYLYMADANATSLLQVDTWTGDSWWLNLGSRWTWSMVASPDDRVLYVAADDLIKFVDTQSGAVIRQVGAGAGETELAVSPDGRVLYATGSSGDEVQRISTSTGEQIDELDVAPFPRAITISPDGARLYVTYDLGNHVSVIDTVSWSEIATIDVGSAPRAVALTPNGRSLYVANRDSDSVSVVDTSTNQVTATVSVGDAPTAIAVDPGGRLVYVANSGSGTLSMIQTASNTVFRTTTVGPSPSAVAVSPDGLAVYVGDSLASTVSVLFPALLTIDPAFTAYVTSVGTAVVGEPTEIAATANGMITQSFTKGTLVYKAGFGVHFVPNGPILDDWLAHVSAYGAPITDAFSISPDSSWVDPSVGHAVLQYFEHEGLVNSDSHGLARIPAGQVLTKYRQVGAAKIGWPLPGDPEAGAVPGTSDTVYAIHFDLQTVATGPGGPWVMDNALFTVWKSQQYGHGGYPNIGYPTADSFQVKAADAPSAGAGVMEFFQAGALAAPVDGTGAATRTPAFVPAGGVLTYLRSNGVAKTGWPVAAPDCSSLPGGCFEQFDLGRVTVSNGKIGFVPQVLVDTWAGTTATTFIGFPTGDAFTISNVGGDSGTLQWFAAGAVVHSDDLGSWFVPAGAVLTTLRSQGIAKTGWPKAAAVCPEEDPGCYQVFSLGTVMVSNAGTWIVPATIYSAWQTGGGAASYGYPAGSAFAATIASGSATLEYFTNGAIVLTPHNGTHAIPGGDLLNAFRRLGPVTTGWPIADATDGQQQFENGILHSDGRFQPPNPGDVKNCTDFATWSQANAWFQTYYPWYGDVGHLDNDNDGVPCQSLPGAP